MIDTPRQLHLNLVLLADGAHVAGWRHNKSPDSFTDIDHFVELARIAERGTFDALFRGDNHGAIHSEHGRRNWHALEPVSLLAAISQRTERIGLIGTRSAIFGTPFEVARQFASLDHITAGRAGWNIVTSWAPETATAFGVGAEPDEEERYRWAGEFVEAVLRLWESLDPDAVVADLATGRFLDETKVREVDVRGRYFSVRATLGSPRTPQGRPVLFQAGASSRHRQYAARWADGLFTVQRTLAGARSFYADVKALAAGYGRRPEDVLVLPGLEVTVGSTEQEARARRDGLNELYGMEHLVEKLAERLFIPPDLLKLDAPLPYEQVESFTPPSRARPFRDQVLAHARARNLTVRELIADNPGGHLSIVGSPERIADHLQTWFVERSADGFNIFVDTAPEGLELFVDHVVPILRRRGIFRHEYPGRTLRDILGVGTPGPA